MDAEDWTRSDCVQGKYPSTLRPTIDLAPASIFLSNLLSMPTVSVAIQMPMLSKFISPA